MKFAWTDRSKRIAYITLTFTAVTLSLLGFQNCAETTFTDAPAAEKIAQDTNTGAGLAEDPVVVIDPEQPTDDPPNPPPEDIEELITTCQQAREQNKLVELEETIRFDDTGIETGRTDNQGRPADICRFSTNADGSANSLGNFTMINNRQQARYRQDRSFSIPEGAILCDLDLEMDRQRMLYDDMFYMSFNGRVIASNASYVVRGERFLEESNPGMVASPLVLSSQSVLPAYTYNWDKVAKAKFSNDGGTDYCLGQEEGLATCTWPKTQETGDFIFDYDPEILVNLGAVASNNNHTISFVITGDDNPDTDCYHEEFNFDIKASYFIPEN